MSAPTDREATADLSRNAPAGRDLDLKLQHPATHTAWQWLMENRDHLTAEAESLIDTKLRALSTLLWDLDRRA